MKCTILHEGKGRMRVHVENVRMTLHRADVLEAYLNHKDAIVHAAVYERTGDVVITYTGKRTAAIAILAGYKFDVAEYDALVTSADSRRLNREYQDKMFDLVAGRCLRKLFLPAPLDAAYTAFRSIRFLWKGVRCVLSRRLEVEVLDALSIGVSLLRGDFGTAGSVMFLLNLGSLLEEWTRKKSLDDLARSMALNVDKVWVRSQGTEVLVPLTKVRSGDEVVVRSGNMIPLDGTVLEGEAMVNQAALTGEAMSGNGGNERVLMPQILDGLRKNEFTFFLQPRYELNTRKVIGAEALVRWNHPTRGCVPPSEFMPLLESTGLVIQLDQYIWESVCKTLHKWQESGSNLVPVSVNVSVVDIVNLVSIRSGYSIGGFDADKIVGGLELGVGKEGEIYHGIGRGELNIAGLPVYRDGVAGVGTPTSDEERTKIEMSTTSLLMILNGYSGKEGLLEAGGYSVDLLKRYVSAVNVEAELICRENRGKITL